MITAVNVLVQNIMRCREVKCIMGGTSSESSQLVNPNQIIYRDKFEDK